jgi:hypothetical protein
MNEFDHFMKRELKVKYYIRYADDFVILSSDKTSLQRLIQEINEFLNQTLKLDLHPHKVFIKTLSSGIDFLGGVHFPRYRVLRTNTKRRIIKGIIKANYIKENHLADFKPESLASSLGILKHGNCHKIFLKSF